MLALINIQVKVSECSCPPQPYRLQTKHKVDRQNWTRRGKVDTKVIWPFTYSVLVSSQKFATLSNLDENYTPYINVQKKFLFCVVCRAIFTIGACKGAQVPRVTGRRGRHLICISYLLLILLLPPGYATLYIISILIQWAAAVTGADDTCSVGPP